jgi:hypothetical protein
MRLLAIARRRLALELGKDAWVVAPPAPDSKDADAHGREPDVALMQALRALALERWPVEQRPVNVHVLEEQVN